MEKAKLLIVEDDPNLGQILSEYLALKGYAADLRQDGEAGLRAFQTGTYHLCILDIMMPKKDGFTLARDIRATDEKMPIIFLTAKSMKEDTIAGLKLGADDYVTKPFSMEELLLRIEAVLRRMQHDSPPEPKQMIFSLGRFTFDAQKQMLDDGATQTRLTTKEADLLRLLCQHQNTTLQRSIALKEVWGDDSYFNARSMDVYIAKLRKLLKPEPAVEIMTRHGEGFALLYQPAK
jgi:DNA-binding response OmpR family regulator